MECAFLKSCEQLHASDPFKTCDLVKTSEIPALIHNKTEFSLQKTCFRNWFSKSPFLN